jgi:hypothetical protein
MGERDFDAVTVVAVAAIAEGLGLGDVAYFHTVFYAPLSVSRIGRSLLIRLSRRGRTPD